MIYHRALSPVGVGAVILAEAPVQAKLQMMYAAFQVSGCRGCLGPLCDDRKDGPLLLKVYCLGGVLPSSGGFTGRIHKAV